MVKLLGVIILYYQMRRRDGAFVYESMRMHLLGRYQEVSYSKASLN